MRSGDLRLLCPSYSKKIMAKIRVGQHEFDLMAFREIADHMAREQIASLRTVSDKLGVSTTAVKSCIVRLECHYGCPLIKIRPRAQDGMLLTEYGRELYEALNAVRRPDRLRPKQQVQIHIAHSLLNSEFLGPLLRDIVTSQAAVGSEIRQVLHPSVSMRFSDVIEELHNRTVDLALVYGFPRRLNSLPSNLSAEIIGPKVPMAFIARSKQILSVVGESPEAIFATESPYRFAGFGEDRQPVPKSFPNDWFLRPNHIEVDTFDAAVALVRSGIADFCVAPSISRGIDQDQLNGKLCISLIPELSVSIAVIVRKETLRVNDDVYSGSSPGSMYRLIKNRLDRAPLVDRPVPLRAGEFPDNIAWYRQLKYAYYIESDRTEPMDLKWFSETLHWDAETSFKANNAELTGKITNCRNAEFLIRTTALLKPLYFVVVEKTNSEPTSAASFVSIFNFCLESEKVICGIWCGQTSSGNRVLNATVWSHQRLSLQQLIEYANSVCWSISANAALAAPEASDIIASNE